jgi:DNA-directed RNA polymerase specialized sigma24 family protein
VARPFQGRVLPTNRSPLPFVYECVTGDVLTGHLLLTATTAQAGPGVNDPAQRVGTLFDTHHQRLYRLARRLCGNADEARDLVQDVFLRVAGAPQAVPTGTSSEEAWLVRVLVNVKRDEWRRTTTKKRLDPEGEHYAAAAAPGHRGAV